VKPALAATHRVLVYTALGWALFNCAYVYLIVGSERAYRIETALFVLAALVLPLAMRGMATETAMDLPARWTGALLALAAALWLATLLPLLRFPFLSDDYVFLDLYRNVGNLSAARQFFRPLFAGVFWALATVGGESSVPFHVASLGLHAGAAWFVYMLTRRLTGGNGPAAVAFGLFLLNPLQLEAVLWASGLQDVLWTFFLLAALVVYVASPDLSPGRIAATGILIGCALASKETAVCFVLLLPAADWIFFRFNRGRWLLATYGVFLAILASYLALRSAAVPIEQRYLVVPTRYFLKELISTPYRFFAQPWNTSMIEVPAAVVALSAMAATALVVAALLSGAARGIVAGAFVVLASTLPVYSYFYVRSDLLSSRYIYFAAAGWALTLSYSLAALLKTRAWFVAVACALTLSSAISLQLNLRPWRAAGDLVATLTERVAAGDSPPEVVAAWQARTGVSMIYRSERPYEYGGVGVFNNGYDEFLAFVARQRGEP
jgi:hypothetical protein